MVIVCFTTTSDCKYDVEWWEVFDKRLEATEQLIFAEQLIFVEQLITTTTSS